jgi:hypothetical protein
VNMKEYWGSNRYTQSTPSKYIYLEYSQCNRSVCPLVRIGTLECAPHPQPPRNQRGEGLTHSPAGEGWESSNADDLRKDLALRLLCAHTPRKGNIFPVRKSLISDIPAGKREGLLAFCISVLVHCTVPNVYASTNM